MSKAKRIKVQQYKYNPKYEGLFLNLYNNFINSLVDSNVLLCDINYWENTNRYKDYFEKISVRDEYTEHFKRHWADVLVEQFSNMLYCNAFNNLRKNLGDRKADTKASELMNKFRKCYVN